MTPKLRSLLTCLILLLSASAVHAATLNVGPGQPYTTIQSAIDAAQPGDTVLVAPGTYYENIDFKGKAITVTSVAGPATTIIDGGGKTSTVTFKSGEPRAAILSNLTITHGGTNPGYAYSGGGIFLSGAQPTILNNIITQNYCQNIYSAGSAPLIQGNTISSSLTPEKCFVLFTGGIHIGGNLQSSYPAASNGTAPIILGNIIEKNTTGQSGDGGGDGGPGIAIWGGSPLIQGNIIRNNVTHSGSGGAVNVVYGSGISIIQNLIYGNTAGCGGGAIGSEEGGLSPDTYLLIANNTIVDDIGGNGGGYSDCRKTSEIWTAFYSGGGPSIKFVNNIIQANLAPALDCGEYNSNPTEATQSLFDHNLLYNTAGPFFGSNCVDLSHLHGNFVADPQFLNLAANDFHLRPTSPAIDAGNSGNFAGSSASCTETVLLKPSTLTLVSSVNPAQAGQPVTFTANVTYGGPAQNFAGGGTVTFADGANILQTATLTSGTVTGTFYAALTTSNLTRGTHTITATLHPLVGYAEAAASISQIVNGITPTTILTATPLNAQAGTSVNLTATITSATQPAPTGTVTFFNGSTILGLPNQPLINGSATLGLGTLPVGTDQITCTYSGDSIYSPSNCNTVPVTITSAPTALTLGTSPNPALALTPVNVTAHLSINSAPAANQPIAIVFTPAAGSPPASVPVTTDATGTAVYTIPAFPPGTYTISAIFAASSTLQGSTTSVSEIINANTTATTFAVSPNPGYQTQPIVLTAPSTTPQIRQFPEPSPSSMAP